MNEAEPVLPPAPDAVVVAAAPPAVAAPVQPEPHRLVAAPVTRRQPGVQTLLIVQARVQ